MWTEVTIILARSCELQVNPRLGHGVSGRISLPAMQRIPALRSEISKVVYATTPCGVGVQVPSELIASVDVGAPVATSDLIDHRVAPGS
jgi:hypothetical protein